MFQYIPIVYISDDNFIMPTSVSITSLILNRNRTTNYLIYIIMAECTAESYQKIKELENLGAPIKLIRASLDKYKTIRQVAHVSPACLLKFDLCELIPEEKIIYIDGDTIVRGDLSELYSVDISNFYAAGVRELNNIIDNTGAINAGMLLYNSKRIRDERLNEKMVQIRMELGDRGSMDQQTFNIVTQKEYVYLDLKYNCVPSFVLHYGKLGLFEINKLYGSDYTDLKNIIDEAIILHFASGEKPWEFTFRPWAKEWYEYYLRSPFKDKPLRLRGIWGYRFDNYLKEFRVSGLTGVIHRIALGVKHRISKETISEKWE